MSTFPNRPFLLLSILIHLVALFAAGRVPMEGPQHTEPRDPVAVRFIDFSPADDTPEETPDSAKIWSSKATKAHGGAAERIAERSASTVTASTPPKGEPLSFQRTDRSPLGTAAFSPDEPPSAQWPARRLTAIASLERPIRLELEPVVSDQATAPRTPLRDLEDMPVVPEEMGPPQELEEAQAPRSQSVPRTAAQIKADVSRPEPQVTAVSPSAPVAVNTKLRATDAEQEALRPEIPTVARSRPLDEAAQKITEAATEPSAPAPEPLLSSADDREMPREHKRTTPPIEGEVLAAPAEAGGQIQPSISREAGRPAREPAEPTVMAAAEMEPPRLKEPSLRLLPPEATLAEDLPPSEVALRQPEREAPELPPVETDVRGPAPEEQREQPEPADVPDAQERPELQEVARRAPPAPRLGTRLRLEGTPPGSPAMPKAGKEILGPEELFPSEIIEKYGAMESDDIDLADVSDAVSLDTNELRYFSYFAKIKKEIEEQWRYPPEAAVRGQHGSLSLLFILDQTGKLKDIRFWKTSGYALLDAAARDAILNADPFPPFPEHLRKERSVLRINARFIYELYETI